MRLGSDGLYEAVVILVTSGASICKGVIRVPKEWSLDSYTRGEIMDALDFLCEEWDYTVTI